MFRFLGCAEFGATALRSSCPTYGTLDPAMGVRLHSAKFNSIASKLMRTPTNVRKANEWITAETKHNSLREMVPLSETPAATRELSLRGLKTDKSIMNFQLKGTRLFRTHFLPAQTSFHFIVQHSSISFKRESHTPSAQTSRFQMRHYSTHTLNGTTFNAKSTACSRASNLCSPPIKANVKSMSTSSGGGLKTIEDVAAYISKDASSVLVMTGAGLSTASGIPDFRSPGTGIYDNLQKYDLPYPEAIFDIQFFMMDPRPFVALAQELYPGLKFQPNAGHHFIRLLQDKGKLRRVYTQNIDGLERLSGIQEDKLMEAHGSFASASCTLCRSAHDPESVKRSILSGPGVPICGVRGCKGKVKPDIVFFGENLPEEFWRFEEDLHAVDLLLIMGTSLEVYPFASIAESARNITPRVLINRTAAGTIGMRPKDCLLQGDIVDTVTNLARLCGWQRELEELGRNV